MHPHPSSSPINKRRVHSPEFKARVLAECATPGVSVAAVAARHGLNANVVHKWLAGLGMKRAGQARPAPRAGGALQFLPMDLASPLGTPVARAAEPSLPCMPLPVGDRPPVHLEIKQGALQLKLTCSAGSAPAYAAVLRALADVVGGGGGAAR